MNVAITCIGLLGVLVFALGFAVSMTRARTETAAGHAADPSDSLHKIVRAHGNTTEYAAMLAVLMWLAASQNEATWVLWTIGAAAASRYLIAAGILLSSRLEKPHPLRFVGALGTYVTGLMLSGVVLASL